MKTIRDVFIRPLPDDNPLDVPDRNWAVTVAYVNDDHATFVSVGEAFGISRERVRQILNGSYRRCEVQAPHLRRDTP